MSNQSYYQLFCKVLFYPSTTQNNLSLIFGYMISTCVIHQTKLNVLNTYVEYENFVNLEAPGVSHILVLQNCEFMASNERPSAVRLRFWSIVIPTQPCSPLNCFGVFGLLQFRYYIHKPAYQWEEGRSHHHLLSVCVCVCVCTYTQR